MENSWYLKEEGLHHFFCKCGQYDVMHENKNEESFNFEIIDFRREDIEDMKISNFYYPDNHCSRCHNKRYLDMNALLFQNKTLYWSEIICSYERCVDDKEWKVVSFLKVPKFEDNGKKFILEKIELSWYNITKDGVDSYTEANSHTKGIP